MNTPALVNPPLSGETRVPILAVERGGLSPRNDPVATEEALEIRVAGTEPVITMRTPGHDRELAAGLLLSEGLVQEADDLDVIRHRAGQPDVLQVVLKRCSEAKAGLLRRSSLSNSACGVCGKNKLNLEIMNGLAPLSAGPYLTMELLLSLPQRLREHQALFAQTGGLHAAALFDVGGQLQAVREDVGRHNALDKLNGWALLNHRLPLNEHIVVLSGRASFELMQKCIMARTPVVCAISAPSSYAVRLAEQFGVTLVGFLREGRFNIYSAPRRIRG